MFLKPNALISYRSILDRRTDKHIYIDGTTHLKTGQEPSRTHLSKTFDSFTLSEDYSWSFLIDKFCAQVAKTGCKCVEERK